MNAVVTRINSMQRPTLGGGRLSGGFGVNCERGAELFVDVTGGTGNWLVTYRQRQRHNYFHSKTDSRKSGILRLIYCIKPKTKKWKKRRTNTHTHIRLTALFPGLPRWPNLDFSEARDSEWQWHLLGHMQVCTSLKTDNHTSTPPLCFLQAVCPSCRPTNSVKALKAKKN